MRVMQSPGGPVVLVLVGILSGLFLLALTFLLTAMGVFFLRRSRQPGQVAVPTLQAPPQP